MSDPSAHPEPAVAPDAVPAAVPGTPPAAVPGAVPDAEAVARPRLNALAVAALILGILLSPLAALFGHLAVGQITRSAGAERGIALAWVAVGLGYLWLAALLIGAVGVAVVLGGVLP